ARQPVLKELATIARHPGFDVNAVLRHRVTADVALVKLGAPLTVRPARLAPEGVLVSAGDRFDVAGYGGAIRGDGKSGGIVAAATPCATGQTGQVATRWPQGARPAGGGGGGRAA